MVPSARSRTSSTTTTATCLLVAGGTGHGEARDEPPNSILDIVAALGVDSPLLCHAGHRKGGEAMTKHVHYWCVLDAVIAKAEGRP